MNLSMRGNSIFSIGYVIIAIIMALLTAPKIELNVMPDMNRQIL